jgi:hypothetical protein
LYEPADTCPLVAIVRALGKAQKKAPPLEGVPPAAALMYLTEREGIDTVFTLDRRDFSISRTSDGRALTMLPHP